MTIAGVGGSGKTRLAIAIGEEECSRRLGGVWFADLTAVMNGDDVPAAIASALGLQLTDGDPTVQVTTYLADKKALVVIDNCEHLIDACAAFSEAFLAVAGQANLLATSREAIDVDGERVMHLPSLTATATGSVADTPAVQLFVERAQSSDPSFHLDTDNAPIIAAICERLDGMPLAIELAAARMTVMSPAELLAGLGDRFRLLSGGRRRQRQRTLEATLDWSFNLLDGEQQRVFRALAVFVGGFDLAAVAAVTGMSRAAATGVIEALVAKSLVVRIAGDTGPSRFGLLETLKAYAEDRLVQSGEAAQVRDRHATHFHHQAMIRGRTLSADLRVGERLHHDKGNITAAFEWSADNDRYTTAGELLLGSLAVYENYGHLAEAKALFHRCEKPLSSTSPELADYLRASILWGLVALDDFRTVAGIAPRLLDSSDAACRTMGHLWLAFLHSLTSPTIADEHLQQGAVSLAEANAEHPGLNTDIAHLSLQSVKGLLVGYTGDYTSALAMLDRLPDNRGRHDHFAGFDLTVDREASVLHLLLGDPTKALERLASFENLPSSYGDGRDIRALAYLALGDIDTAQAHIRSQAIDAQTGRLIRQCNDGVLLLAALADAEGDRSTAIDLLLQMGIGRNPTKVMYARDLARRLGIADQLTACERTLLDPTSWAEHGVLGARTAMTALRNELTRRGWD